MTEKTKHAVAPYVVLLAAGSGERLTHSLQQQHAPQANIPKAYQRIDHRSVLEICVQQLLLHPHITPDRIQIVISPGHRALYEALPRLPAGLRPACDGGACRAQSMWFGLQALVADQHNSALSAEVDSLPKVPSENSPNVNPEIILVHDAARPMITPTLIQRLLVALDGASAVIPVLSVHDALKHRQDLSAASREGFFITQTPQAFHFKILYSAFSDLLYNQPTENHATLLDRFADEAAVIQQHKAVELTTVAGQRDNLKITDSSDLDSIRQRLGSAVLSTYTAYGTGFDLHCFDISRTAQDIRIAGCNIAHPHPLIGHSDGDVVLHALCDALYGSVAAGDIGQHFPPDDPQWKDQDSVIFLQHALATVQQHKAKLLHIDVTVIADQPKINPIRGQLCQRVAELCTLKLSQVSIKATTTEGLGFIDSRHAIAAQVMVSVQRPYTELN